MCLWKFHYIDPILICSMLYVNLLLYMHMSWYTALAKTVCGLVGVGIINLGCDKIRYRAINMDVVDVVLLTKKSFWGTLKWPKTPHAVCKQCVDFSFIYFLYVSIPSSDIPMSVAEEIAVVLSRQRCLIVLHHILYVWDAISYWT